MTAEQQSFVEKIREDPADDGRWLVYADWLAEHEMDRLERAVRWVASSTCPVTTANSHQQSLRARKFWFDYIHTGRAGEVEEPLLNMAHDEYRRRMGAGEFGGRDVRGQLEDYMNGLRRYMTLEGMEMSPVGLRLSDPTL